MRDKTNTAISKQFCTSYFNFGFCSERLARLNSTACLQFLCSHHSTINPGGGYHNHHHQHFLWKVSSFLCTHLPFLIKRFLNLFMGMHCPPSSSVLLHPPPSVRPNTHSHSHCSHLLIHQQSLLSAQLEAATTTTIILIHTISHNQPPPPH
jgi:hypothetical protein